LPELFSFIVNMFTNIPNHQRFLQQERFKVGVKFKQFLAKGGRKPESELDGELDGVNCDEENEKYLILPKLLLVAGSLLLWRKENR